MEEVGQVAGHVRAVVEGEFEAVSLELGLQGGGQESRVWGRFHAITEGLFLRQGGGRH